MNMLIYDPSKCRSFVSMRFHLAVAASHFWGPGPAQVAVVFKALKLFLAMHSRNDLEIRLEFVPSPFPLD